MKKATVYFSALLMAVTLVACGVPQEEFDQVQASAAAVQKDRDSVKTQLAGVEAELASAQSELDELRTAEKQRQEAAEAEKQRVAEEKKSKEEAEKKEKEKLNKAKKVSKRELSQIVKKPDSHLERNVIIYARVTQFDSATGPCTFRANVAHAHVGKYDYEHNSMFSAGDGLLNCDILDDVVADDIIEVTAEITGSLTYSTQIGGSTTVPEFQVVKLKRL